MGKITATDTLELSIPERIELVEDIWDTIVAEEKTVTLTESEKRLIDERLEAYHKDPNAGSHWEDVKKKILGKQ